MKKLSLFLFLICSTFLISCSNDDDSSSLIIDENLILGEWNLTGHVTENGRTVTEGLGQTLVAEYSTIGKDFDATLTFLENPKTYISEGGYTGVTTTTFQGQTTTEEIITPDVLTNGEWSIENNKLIVVDPNNETLSFEVLTLNENEMVLRHNLNQNLDQLGLTITTTATITMTLSK